MLISIVFSRELLSAEGAGIVPDLEVDIFVVTDHDTVGLCAVELALASRALHTTIRTS